LVHPTAALTGLDESLAVFVGDFPPQWDGYVQLRLYLNAPNAGEYTTTYNATNLVIKGDKWSAVGDSPVSCGGSTAVSDKEVEATNSAAAASLTTQTVEGAGGSTPPSKGGKTATSGSSKSASSTAGAQGAQATSSSGALPAASGSPAIPGSSPATESGAASAGSGGHGSGSHTLLWVLVVVAVLGAGFVGIQWVRSRQ
jgi:cobalamin biosynthesis Mg chelatase CobN